MTAPTNTNWIDDARARTEPRYQHLIGKQAPPMREGAPVLQFLGCLCGIVEPVRGAAVCCDNCEGNARNGDALASERVALSARMVAAPRQARTAAPWVLAGLLLLVAALVLGDRVADAPSRDDVMRGMEAS